MKNDGFAFIKYCNEQTSNTNEQKIAQVLMENLSRIDEISLDDIADQACISAASVSRLVKNAGFTSFKDFKAAMVRFQHRVMLHRSNTLSAQFSQTLIEDFQQETYKDALENIQATIRSLQLDQLIRICFKLQNAERVVILGDGHELHDFYTLQLDLIAHGIPAWLINILDEGHVLLQNLNRNDLVLYIDLYQGWFKPDRKRLLDRLFRQNVQLVILAQEPDEYVGYTDEVLGYGVPDSLNNGYYSLPLISRMFCDLLYHPACKP